MSAIKGRPFSSIFSRDRSRSSRASPRKPHLHEKLTPAKKGPTLLITDKFILFLHRIARFFHPSAYQEDFNVWGGPNALRHVQVQRDPDAAPPQQGAFYSPPNTVSNQKYTLWSFIFIVLYNQFKYFFNFYFLMVCLSQFWKPLKVTNISANLVPLVIALTVCLVKEAQDDYKRYLRDKEINEQPYKRMQPNGKFKEVQSKDIQIGDVILVEKNERAPADLVLLQVQDTGTGGTCFIRTDQLDGETDWKLRVAVAQKVPPGPALQSLRLVFEAPRKDIHSFNGYLEHNSGRKDSNTVDGAATHDDANNKRTPLTVENTVWANTIVASGAVVGAVIYTGSDTRAVRNTSSPVTKAGAVDIELNSMSKALCIILMTYSIMMVVLRGYWVPSPEHAGEAWHVRWGWVLYDALLYTVRYIVLLSAIIPLSLRSNLDLGKSVYASDISNDKEIPGVIVRSSMISEELGRIRFLFDRQDGHPDAQRNVPEKDQPGGWGGGGEGGERAAPGGAERAGAGDGGAGPAPPGPPPRRPQP